MNKIIKNALILAAITLIAGLLLGAAHQVTLEPIQKQQEKEKQESCQNVFPEAASFEEVTMSDAEQAVNPSSISLGLRIPVLKHRRLTNCCLQKTHPARRSAWLRSSPQPKAMAAACSSRWELHRTERQKESLSCHFPRRPALVCVPTQTISRISSRIKT